MSRRRGEFEHRTSIFEGAYRAWSHLGGCDATKMMAENAAEDLDPLNYPHYNDERFLKSNNDMGLNASSHNNNNDGTSITNNNHDNTGSTSMDGTSTTATTNSNNNDNRSSKIQYYYEPLPRAGLSHPFVQGIIAAWLGPTAEEEDLSSGLTTLRTWWQHRRRGESASAIKQLGTQRMIGVVEGYTRHFFKLALCFVVQDHEQPPRSLQGRLELEVNPDNVTVGTRRSNTSSATGPTGTGFNRSSSSRVGDGNSMMMDVEMSKGGGDCCAESVSTGTGTGTMSESARRKPRSRTKVRRDRSQEMDVEQMPTYGDPTKTPVVFVSANGDIQIAMSITGITCTQCVKMVETVLRGVDGSPSPIEGVLDAVGDQDLSAAIIKISKASDAKRIGFQASALLSMLGYQAVAREMNVVDNLDSLKLAYDVVAATDPGDVFDWTLQCNCPDSGLIRADCVR